MNDNIKIPTMKITPLKKICMTIGELPTSYLETMTYYEMLVWFTNYLRDSIIPAVNNNAEAVHELQTLFVELQNYVNNYFDNLDVQEEINNKLDDMVEAGTLQEIIGEYLNANAVWGFNTVADMKESTNLIDGSYARTLGYNELNDGGSSLYKIREITNDDVVDNINIIPMETSDNLIAELIYKNINRNKRLITINKVDNGTNYNINLAVSYDGINFGNIATFKDIEIPHEHHNAGVNFTYENGYFYVLSSIGYWYSKDLKEWSEKQILGNNISGPYLYENKLYFTEWDYNTPIINDVGVTTYSASIGYYDVTFNNDGSLTISNKTILKEGTNETSYIDVVVKEFNGIEYLACKNEVKCVIELYTKVGNTLTLTNFTHKGIGIEACKLIPDDDSLFIYADPYGLQTNYENTTNVSYDRGLSIRMTAINNEGINTDALLTAINSSYDYHPGFELITNDKAISIIDSLPYAPILVKPTQYYKQINMSTSTNNEIISIINHPTRPTFIAGNTANSVAYLRFTKIFEEAPVMLRFDVNSGTVIHPAYNVNGKVDTSSTDEIIKQEEVIIAPVYNYSLTSMIYLPVEQFEYRRKLEVLPTNQALQTSLNQKFLKSNTVNFFIISGYDTDITVNKLPTASNFFGEYYKQNQNFGHIKLYRIGNTIVEYQATIAAGTISEWTQTH